MAECESETFGREIGLQIESFFDICSLQDGSGEDTILNVFIEILMMFTELPWFELLIERCSRYQDSERLYFDFKKRDPADVEDGKADECHDVSWIDWLLPGSKAFVFG